MNNSIIPKYCDNTSILLINSVGALKKLYCPFRIKVHASIGNLEPDTYLWVEEVSCTQRDELIYFIHGKPYHHKHFLIQISF